ncbi:MAG: acyl-CoA/acyl-ACP dehydrogenase [Gammaproteobacteria bacterium]|nr:acyl-CoA/acyl-ACP dehydrogenase [Gammaproteobacteria bacterium]
MTATAHRLATSPADLDLQGLVAAELVPRVTAIDLEGEYPEAFLRALGACGGFADAVAPEHGGSGRGLAGTIDTMATLAATCLSTAFTHWCHTACARYIQLSENARARRELLPDLATGRLLGGTGLSNTLKSASGIEPYRLRARRVAGGYVVNGTLPWVSNLGDDHVFVTGCPVTDDDRLVFFVVHCDQPGFRLLDGAHFTALEGTATRGCRFRDVRIDEARVLAHPDESARFLQRIQPGLILGQVGMALGLVRDCLRLVEEAGRTLAHVNVFEPLQATELAERLVALEQDVAGLAPEVDAVATRDDPAPATLRQRVQRGRHAPGGLALAAGPAGMLHHGARGYLRTATAQRRLREAYFIAIVTPALKHLRREIARLEG